MKYKKKTIDLNFKDSIKIGKKKEHLVKKILEKYFDTIEENDDYKYDLIVKENSKKIKLEIKFDDMFNKTNNFAVEFESRRRPSGITTTESDYWIFVDSKNSIYIIETKILKKICIGKKKIQTRCKDSYNRIYLIPKNEFLKKEISLKEFIDLFSKG